MLRLNRYILGLVVWLAFLFNIERFDLDIGNTQVSNIASSIYVVSLLVVIAGILLPQWKPVPVWVLQALGAGSFVAAIMSGHRPVWGGVYTYISLVELAAVLISATLGYMVGRLSADFVATVRSLLFADMDDRVYSADKAENAVRREMQYSRRANRPLSVMVLDANSDGAKVELRATAHEIQRLLVKRHSLVALTRLMTQTLRRTDFVVDQTAEGRLVLVMPELRADQTTSIIDRLNERAQRRLGVSLNCSVATFPDQGLTFEELMSQAERNLRPTVSERRSELLAGQEIGESNLVGRETAKLAVVEAGSLQARAES